MSFTVTLDAPQDAPLKRFLIRTANGVREWQAEDADHAREQHTDAFSGHPGEDIEDVSVCS